MRLVLTRQVCAAGYTLGEIHIYDGARYGVAEGAGGIYTCEDEDRRLEDGGTKIRGSTAIPLGLYRVAVTQSKRFGKRLPILASVPGFEGIRIHAGNTSADTEGCILVGQERTATGVARAQSRATWVTGLIERVLQAGESVTLDVVREVPRAAA